MFLPNAHSAEMVNVEYIHQYLNTRWGIDLPYSPELTNPRVAANMKYLLTVVDIANEFLNNEQTTDYGNGEYATLAAADTVATTTAIDTLVKAPTFTITTTPNTSSFNMIIGAAGNFIIDWGDGARDVIADKPIGTTTYTHSYNSSGEYEIKLTGRATDYSDAAIDPDTGAGLVPTFTLTNALNGSIATNVAKISGGLGRVFPTMDDGSNPNFYGAFAFVPITEIPADLFDGIHGTPAVVMFTGTFMGTQITEVPAYIFGELNGDGAMGMFSGTFTECPNLTTIDGPLFSGTITPATSMFAGTFENTALTEIPADLFAGIQGAPADYMFSGTFENTAITEIPADLFAGIQGAPADYMFSNTFSNTDITSVPANLFGTLNGDGASSMFSGTFNNCPNLTTIDGPLFSGIITPAEYMFNRIFRNTALTEIPADLFAGVRGAPAANMFSSTFADTALTEIPADLFAGIQGAPADYMFSSTFSGCSELQSIPANLFGELNGDGAMSMFDSTFSNCSNLTTIEGPLFSGTITPAQNMFLSTFSNTALTEIPADLFAGVQGAPVYSVFGFTFSNTPITEIPADLFAGIQGAPADRMFSFTFNNCTQLQSIPENLFAGISGPAADFMFASTFANCTSLTGPSARINGQYLYEIWPNGTRDMNTYKNATGLSDYDQIPLLWK